jgi:radical SAM superfamily enzyme
MFCHIDLIENRLLKRQLKKKKKMKVVLTKDNFHVFFQNFKNNYIKSSFVKTTFLYIYIYFFFF